MTKKLLLVLALVMPFMLSAQEIKMGYINSQEVLMLMPELNEVEKQMADFNEKNQKYLQEMQKEIEAKMAKFEQEKDNMTEVIRKVQEEDLQLLYQRYQTAQQTIYQEYQQQQQKLIQPLQDKLKNAIETVGKKQGLYFVFDMAAGAVIYKCDKAVDVTPAVKKELGIL